ncbi:MAG: PEP-utilizing enzyme, partial [Candidatus Magasanikiibacteriota bacterium]
PGLAKGKVKIIIRAEDMKKMNHGDILVSIATDPDIVPAMKKAAAIITEQGGVTSHAAIVSRELNIPCVIGTKIATKVLQDGDTVEVDANNGIIKII